ncbi:hypothetical protein CALVIDRAFT_279744 [Calocera viscosa TUFC12733]|uniref:RNase III domain-containing protein n=1 Tax=Calocera viscosa (strain TUFC12733) TaxID=1330018 RepID=A0A167R4U6_CALVF|nr:hypothetical protein CALVIDRAFT_279744 [Calocera viscosa TUFC12733]
MSAVYLAPAPNGQRIKGRNPGLRTRQALPRTVPRPFLRALRVRSMATAAPLPPIMDANRRAKVFNHKGLADDNTRLALLGAALLVTIATLYKLAQYDHGATGQVTSERSLLVRQEAMASYAVHYSLQNHLRARENVEHVQNTPSAQATLFEAYVAAVFVESNFNFAFVRDWLFSLWNLRTPQ